MTLPLTEIVTSNSKIYNQAGSLASGTLLVRLQTTPVGQPLLVQDTVSTIIHEIHPEENSITVSNGGIVVGGLDSAIFLVPNVDRGQLPTGSTYRVSLKDEAGTVVGKEVWQVSGDVLTPTTIEFGDIVRQIDVSARPAVTLIDPNGFVALDTAEDGDIILKNAKSFSGQTLANVTKKLMSVNASDVVILNEDNLPVTCTGDWTFDGSVTFGSITLVEDATNVLALRNGTNPQIFRIYNTYTSASDFERASLVWFVGGNEFVISTDSAGTGVGRDLSFTIGGNNDVLHLNPAGAVYINNDSNTFNTSGLTVDQESANDEILALKSNIVVHGMTVAAEDDTIGTFKKEDTVFGGMEIAGYKGPGDTHLTALALAGRLDDAADTNKTINAEGIIELRAAIRTGTSFTNVGTNGNLVIIADHTSTRFIFDKEGALHLVDNVTGNTDIVGNSKWFINETTNANMTQGLTINQGANGDEIIALKSSDVSHGMTTLTEDDTYGVIQKTESTSGGLAVIGYKDADGSAGQALNLGGRLGEAADTAKTTSAEGVVTIQSAVKSGTTTTTVGADGNLVVIKNLSTTRFIFDAEGSAHADVEWIAFDEHDDIGLLHTLQYVVAEKHDPVAEQFGRFVSYNKADLQNNKIMNFYDNGPRAMMNQTRMLMLHTGALCQLGQKWSEHEDRLIQAADIRTSLRSAFADDPGFKDWLRKELSLENSS